MPEKQRETTELPNNNRAKIFAILALTAFLSAGCDYDMDAVCQAEGYDGASEQMKKNWEIIKKREAERGNSFHDIELGVGSRNICYGFEGVGKNKKGKYMIRCRGNVGRCVGEKKEERFVFPYKFDF